MTDLLTRTVTALESIATALTALAETPDKKAEPTKTEKPAATKKTTTKKAESKAEPKAEPKTETKSDEPEFDYDLLKGNVIKLATKFGADGKAAAIELLAKYGVTKADQAPADQWPAMNEEFEAAIKGFDTKGDDDFA